MHGRVDRGFSLVEFLVVIGVLSLIAGVAFQFISHSRNTEPTLSNRLILHMEARKAADTLIAMVREGSEVVRPYIGETLPYLILKDLTNQTVFLYLEADQKHSKAFDKPLWQLISYTNDYSGTYDRSREKCLLTSIEQIRFSCISPLSVQVDATLVNDKGAYQFVTHVGLMNIGGLE